MPIPGSGTVHAVSLDELKAQLNISVATYDTELTRHRDAAEEAATAYMGGRMAYQGKWTENLSSDGGAHLMLAHTPVISVTSVTENGTTLAATEYTVSYEGVLTRTWGTYTAGLWTAGFNNVTIIYVAGESPMAESIKQGVLVIAAHLWEQQRGNMTSVVGQGGESEWAPLPSYSIPRRAQELLDLAPGGILPGVA
jgi:hypothetical protein